MDSYKIDQYNTRKMDSLHGIANPSKWEPVPETPIPSFPPEIQPLKTDVRAKSRRLSVREVRAAQKVQDQCRQFCSSAFFNPDTPVRCLGFTSAIAGEGKSFLAMVTAKVLAEDSGKPVTLIECNWEHPNLHESFNCDSSPGLAEWLRGECNDTAIHRQINHNLTFIPAGRGKPDTMRLLQQIQKNGLLDFFGRSGELLVVDLPAIAASPYASLTASFVESLVFVVCAGITTESQLTEAYAQVANLPIQGIALNRLESRIPHWIRQML